MSSKNHFNDVAPEWDRLRQSYFSEAVREKAIAIAQVQPGKLAADLGAGTGFITEALVHHGLRVIAVDQSEAMLSEMQKKFAGVQGIAYRPGDAEQLPIEDASVDYVFANAYLHNVEHPLKAIREIARILKPGGKAVVTYLDERSYKFLPTEQRDRWLDFKREDVRRWFVEAGLKNIRVDCLDENCCTNSPCGCEEATISVLIATGMKGDGKAATSYPYATYLDIKYPSLTVIDLPALIQACKDRWYNQTLCQVNDSVVRLGIVQGEYHWHKHDNDDEFFFVLEGRFIIDLETHSVELRPWQGFVVPKGVVHRTRAAERCIILMVETSTIIPTGDDNGVNV
ncbi:2-methoxy-6-polyprenyl-1,4-benzoquinol methylase, mitochondrial [Rubrobacter xylanophilus DSM 9941]|uniref:methyltransferase domain-containing protein n=1 Tax=Rubrobacter xylanophilus TaxID=49319 RepID=UPI001C63F002|nr:methyltransferase domain-containing protein [Rubrobacter xylanophilus]QYJ14274.1 2-methoxy-6-polyprenyl-1,4-benzoquinol methylase, mitochondrial [Rubrobacter xylanophilus DSM 9941]